MNRFLTKLTRFFGKGNLFETRVYRLVQAGILFIAMLLIVVVGILPAQHDLEIGQIALDPIYAPREVIDYVATAKAAEQAAEAVEDVYQRDPQKGDLVAAEVTAIIEYVLGMDRDVEQEVGSDITDEASDNAVLEELVAQIEAEFPERYNRQTIELMLITDAEELTDLAIFVNEAITDEMRNPISDENKDFHLQRLISRFNESPANPQLVNLMVGELIDSFEPNFLPSREATEAKRRDAWNSVEKIRILQGAKIIDKGEEVTETHLSQLQALGLLHTSFAYGYYAGLAGILMVVFATWAYYLYRLRPELFSSASAALLLGLIILLTLGFSKLAVVTGVPLLMPAAMAAMLITILFDLNLGLFFGISLSLIIGIMSGGEYSMVLLTLIGSIIAAFCVTKVNQRSDLTRAGLILAAGNVIVILALRLVGEGITLDSFFQELLLDLFMGFGAGVLASILAIGLLPFFENSFGITTSVRLLELANPNQRPLKRLLLEAPGTYHHSIIVGNLAEAAAEAVNADPILARVGSYYHDLGKLSRPYFFIENQFSGDNPHDRIPPSLSSMILTAHVKYGVELANQYKLPPVIRSIIQQHHGESLIGYFYHRALSERTGKDQLLEDRFRYEGPRPQFKEAGIIMLADSVEAAVRSLSQPSQFRVSNMVKKIIDDKLADGQLDHCDLTLRELNIIAEAFVNNLAGSYHKRIAYPTEQELAKAGAVK